ncbi:hypothetical protein GCM10022406_00800 [Hymenobacter algoricola]|uniref:Uncharacterized protein n=1 Tax=Hymenobacter algoricola TaxID=486267 RepID=A0ABP7MCZ0_9BACT
MPLLAPAQTRRAARPTTTTTAVTTSAQGSTLQVTGVCAVIYAPNPAKMNRLRQQYGESNINTSADDNHIFVARSRAYLQEKGLRVVETTATQLRFTTAAGATTVLDISGLAFSWGLLLFNGRSAPQEANLADPATDVQTVMKK